MIIYKILWKFEIKIDHQIPVRIPDINKKINFLDEFTVLADPKVKVKELEKYQDIESLKSYGTKSRRWS